MFKKIILSIVSMSMLISMNTFSMRREEGATNAADYPSPSSRPLPAPSVKAGQQLNLEQSKEAITNALAETGYYGQAIGKLQTLGANINPEAAGFLLTSFINKFKNDLNNNYKEFITLASLTYKGKPVSEVAYQLFAVDALKIPAVTNWFKEYLAKADESTRYAPFRILLDAISPFVISSTYQATPALASMINTIYQSGIRFYSTQNRLLQGSKNTWDTPLMMVMRFEKFHPKDKIALINFLIKAGAMVNEKGGQGNTALHAGH